MPAISYFEGIPWDNDRRPHPRNELSIAKGAKIVVRWSVSGASKVKIAVQPKNGGAPSEMDPIDASELTTTLTPEVDCEYRLIALGEDGEDEATSADVVNVYLTDAGATTSAIAYAEHHPDAEVNGWPLIICGPMLRRVDEKQVCVFVATKLPCTVTLELYCEGAQAGGHGSAETIALGPYLHVALVQFVPETDLKPGKLYSYDLALEQEDGTQKLSALAPQLSYGSDGRPSFSLPPLELSALNLVHGSCRKAHSQGEDALALIDQVYAGSWSDPARRPHQLLLTGDQIYADDVELTLSRTIRRLAKKLTAPYNDGQWDGTFLEKFPGGISIDSADVEPGDSRASFILTQSGFKEPRDKELMPGHLLFLCEFLAMYVLAFSDAIWPANETWPPAVAAFHGRLPLARKVLANVPTYMILDDHEITDDWNLTYEWSDRVHKNDVGRQIVRNGLLAYAVFQHWGNAPGKFTDGFGKQILAALTAGEQPPPILGAPDSLKDILALNRPGQNPSREDRLVWDFVVDGPEHRIIFLDTRTSRELPHDPRAPKLPCGLLDAGAVNDQVTAQKPSKPQLTIIVSAAPFAGVQLVERGIAWLAMVKTPEYLDAESWAGNESAFRRMAVALTSFKQVVILSGDVHYGFAAVMDTVNGAESARVVQFCSSALHNEDNITGLPGRLERGEGGLEDAGSVLFPYAEPNWEQLGDVVGKLRQSLEGTATGNAVQSNFDQADAMATSALLDMMVRAKLSPSMGSELLRLKNLPVAKDLHDHLAQMFSTQRHRIRLITDDRDAALRGTDSSPWLDGFVRAAVGYCNFGVVTFAGTGADPRSARQTLYWTMPASPDKVRAAALANTVYQASLVPLPPGEVQ